MSQEFYKQYVTHKAISDPQLLKKVMTLLAVKANKKLKAELIKQTDGIDMTMKKLHNIDTKRKKMLGPEGIQIKNHFEALVRDRGALVKITIEPSSQNVQNVSYSTSFMRDVFDMCPQVVFVDSTFCVNTNNYTLLGFMVMDPLGNGQLAQVSLQHSNNGANFEEAVRHFQATQPRWKDVRVFVCDKDLKEVNLLEKYFPQATVVLCLFHVEKHFREECTKDKYKLSKEQRDAFKTHASIMIYAKTAEDSARSDSWLLEHILEVRTHYVTQDEHEMCTYTLCYTL